MRAHLRTRPGDAPFLRTYREDDRVQSGFWRLYCVVPAPPVFSLGKGGNAGHNTRHNIQEKIAPAAVEFSTASVFLHRWLDGP